jgi:valyl-tRNA synthetase
MALLEEHGSDGVRYWAASGRPGADTAFDAGQMRVGRRLAIKLLNASRFALSNAEPRADISVPLDRGMLTGLSRLVTDSTEQLEQYNYAAVLERVERWFWFFCDDYLELVKSRRYGAQGVQAAGSANSALVTGLSVILRLFAPFLPFVTEEVWSWWREGSIHRARWPTPDEVERTIGGQDARGALTLERAALVLGEVRKTKSEAKRPLTTPVEHLMVRDTAAHLSALCEADADVRAAGFVQTLEPIESEQLEVVVRLAGAAGNGTNALA